jgi:hypothetical protein
VSRGDPIAGNFGPARIIHSNLALTPGTRLGPYEVVSAIGAGGMGEVYRATDSKLGRAVAIKVLPDSFALDADRLMRFTREAKTLASLNHPNIAQIYGIEDSGGSQALIMELVEGDDLSALIAARGLNIDDALKIARHIADALDAAHEQGIIHRDLKPANIKVRADGTVKILDFGLAKAMDPAGAPSGSAGALANSPTMTSPAMTEMGMILGTAAYMSPEQARGRVVDTRADIWAFGAVLFEMLAGRPLFAGETVTDTLAAVLTREIDWSLLPSSTPPGVVRLLGRCLERDVRKRLRDIGDARWDLDEPASASHPALPLPPPAMQTRAAGGVRVLAWTAAALVLAVAALAWAWPTSAPVEETPIYFEVGFPRDVEPVPTLGAGFGISPDGRRLFLIGSRSGARRLLLRSLDDLETVELADPDGIGGAAFSPDGSSLALLRASGRVDTFSLGDSRRATVATGADQAGLITWGEAGIVYSSNGALRLASPDGGGARSVTEIDAKGGEVLHSDAVALPGGRVLLFAVQTRDGSGDRIEAVHLADSAKRTVVVEGAGTPIWSPTGHLLFERDGAMFAVPFNPSTVSVTGPAVPVLRAGSIASKNNGGLAARLSAEGSLAYVPATAGRTRVLSVARNGAATDLELPPGAYAQPRVAPNQWQLVVSQGIAEMLVVDATRGSTTRIGPPAHGVNYGTWVANGQWIVWRLFSVMSLAAPDGSGARSPVPHAVVNDYPSSPGPDADSLLVTRITPERSGDIYLFSLSGAYAPKPLVASPGYDGGATLSPDGRWMLYYSSISGQGEAYVTRFPQIGRQWQVSAGGGRQVRWSGDGREVYYRANGKFMAVAFGGAGAEPEIGKPAPLFSDVYDFGTAISLATYDVTKDGRFIVTKREDGTSSLQVVSNWTAELRRIVAAGGVK